MAGAQKWLQHVRCPDGNGAARRVQLEPDVAPCRQKGQQISSIGRSGINSDQVNVYSWFTIMFTSLHFAYVHLQCMLQYKEPFAPYCRYSSSRVKLLDFLYLHQDVHTSVWALNLLHGPPHIFLMSLWQINGYC